VAELRECDAEHSQQAHTHERCSLERRTDKQLASLHVEQRELGVARLVLRKEVLLPSLLDEHVLELLECGGRAALNEGLELAAERLGAVVDGLHVGVAEVLDGGGEGVDLVLQERVAGAGGVAVDGGEVPADGLLWAPSGGREGLAEWLEEV
jgi:hypothetical protein